MIGIIQTPMDPFHIPRESGARLLGIIADGNYEINSSVKIIIDRV
jgi:hypothetical protein